MFSRNPVFQFDVWQTIGAIDPVSGDDACGVG